MNLKKLLSFEQGRIAFFETLTKHPENWQQNPTPLSIVRKMLDKTSLDDKKILVLFNIEFLQVLVEERKINPENIYYIADNELEFLGANKIFKVQSYKLNDFTVPALKKLVTGIDMKFDLVFSNPPYNKNVDIKILNEIVTIANEFIVIHPSIWILDNKRSYKLYNDFRDKINSHLHSVEMFNANKVFDIRLNCPIAISHIDMSFNGDAKVTLFDEVYNSKNIYDITKFGSKWFEFVQDFSNKIEKYCNQNTSLSDHCINVQNIQNGTSVLNNEYYCQSADIIGTPSSENKSLGTGCFYTIMLKNPTNNTGIRKNTVKNSFKFSSDLERQNFINYCLTDFARFCLSLTKNNTHADSGELELVPWLDFTEEWDDEKLFEKFEVSQELQDYIREFLPDFHGIRK